MDRQDMIRRFKQETGSYFINRKQLTTLMGRNNPHQVDWILSGLERTKDGKLYYIPDVVSRIIANTEVKSVNSKPPTGCTR